MRALLIGCGNIGALYDIDNNEVQSHAKAYSLSKLKVDVIEPNVELRNRICIKYGFIPVEYSKVDFTLYDIVSICSPTDFHFQYLNDCLKSEVPVVLCEKPLVGNLEELEKIEELYSKSKSRVLVNYMRRFLSGYQELKNTINGFNESLVHVNCLYYKGVMNYASHALDLVEMLTSFTIDSEDVSEVKRKNDFFSYDPTITFRGETKGVSYSFEGLGINYSMFEIELIFNSYRISIVDGGDTAVIKKNNVEVEKIKNLKKDYMLSVMDKATSLVHNQNELDNFKESYLLNRTLLKIITAKNIDNE